MLCLPAVDYAPTHFRVGLGDKLSNQLSHPYQVFLTGVLQIYGRMVHQSADILATAK